MWKLRHRGAWEHSHGAQSEVEFRGKVRPELSRVCGASSGKGRPGGVLEDVRLRGCTPLFPQPHAAHTLSHRGARGDPRPAPALLPPGKRTGFPDLPCVPGSLRALVLGLSVLLAGTACPCRHHAGCGALGLGARQARWESPGQRPTNSARDVADEDQGGLWLGSRMGLSYPAPETGWSPRLAFCLPQEQVNIDRTGLLHHLWACPHPHRGSRWEGGWVRSGVTHSGAGARTKPRGQGSGLPLGWWAQARLVERGLWVCWIQGSCSPALGGPLSISWQGRLMTSIRHLSQLVPGPGWGWPPAPRGVSA